MDAPSVPDEILREAKRLLDAGEYRKAMGVLEPLFGRPPPQGMTPRHLARASNRMSQCHRMLGDERAALPHSKLFLKLAPEVWGKGSWEHSQALQEAGMVKLGLKDFTSAQKIFNQAVAMLQALKMENTADFGGALMDCADVNVEQKRFPEALAGYMKCKAVMDNFKNHRNYGTLLNKIGYCMRNLKRHDEAVAYYREDVEWSRAKFGTQHPDYAISLRNLGYLYEQIKQFEFAIKHYEEAIVIYKRVYGVKHPHTIGLIQNLANCRNLQKKDRTAIKTDHAFRMCNVCLKVDTNIKNMRILSDKLYYCSQECADKLWPEHRRDSVKCDACLEQFPDRKEWIHCPTCYVNKYCSAACKEKHKEHKCVARCYKCHKEGVKLMQCSACNVATYCDAECQKAHWAVHKKECKKK